MAPSTSSPPRNSATESSTEKASTNTAHNNSHPPKQSKPKVQTAPPKPLNSPSQQKKPHRKPIIDWFQRKLGGTAKGKRVVDESLAKGNGRVPVPQRSGSRVVTPGQPATIGPGGRQQSKLEAAAAVAARRKTVSLNGDDDIAQYNDRHSDEEEDDRSLNESFAQESVWSPNSVQEADEDASLRPLPPSSPPSPSPSRSSSSYLSDPRTFKSIAASTKPTTLLSIDLHGNGMAHIAQAPLTPTRYAHARSSSNATNPNVGGQGQVPPSPQTSSRPVSFQDPLTIITTPNAATQQSGSNSLVVQAPLHTTHHPRNNPRPLSPPPDDASVLTLASSAYAIPGLRVAGLNNWSSPPSAIGGGGDSVSHFGGTYADAESTSQLAIDDDRLDDRDADASVRALRPRSTRRGSWESEASRWSARIQVTGPPSLGGGRERSLWTSNSIRTGTLSTENVDTNELLDDEADGATGEVNVGREEEKETEREASSQATVDGQEEVGANDGQGDTDVSKQQQVEELTQAKDKEDDDRPAVDRKVSSDTVNSPTRATADEREGKDESQKRHEPNVAEEKEPAEPEKIQIMEATDETPKVSEHMEATQAKLVVAHDGTPEGAAEPEGTKVAESPAVSEGKEVAVTQSPAN
ncbi:hypothetical protein AAF712_002143 [Marasmius tenuissimus]|uniref:Uncharacterized protein n=1 Tax=Marasmius tenuissimus TaxID=585030 RepID=A0ABR3AAD3_9AGAR